MFVMIPSAIKQKRTGKTLYVWLLGLAAILLAACQPAVESNLQPLAEAPSEIVDVQDAPVVSAEDERSATPTVVVPATATPLPTPTAEIEIIVEAEPELIIASDDLPVSEAATGQELTKPRMVMFWSAY